jgi:hypothetical protein
LEKKIQGLENLSSDNLSKGREFVLEHLMNNSTLKDKQLQAILVAAVESGDGIREIIDGKLCKRQSVVSCVSALETGLKILSKHIEPKESLHREDNDATFLGYVWLSKYCNNLGVLVDELNLIPFFA